MMIGVFKVQQQYPEHNIQIPSVLKGAIIKTFGYLIQHEKESRIYTQNEFVCNEILEICLSSQILNDTNINVFIRNSWTISFICNLYPIENIIKSKFQICPDKSNLEVMIDACSKYAELQASNKEKVAASSIRALGFIVQNLIILDHKQTTNPSQEKILSVKEIKTYIEQIVDLIVDKLHNSKKCTPKVIWNLCVATSKFVDTFNKVNNITSTNFDIFNYESCFLNKIFSYETTMWFLDIFMNGQNYKTKIHACQTLLKYVNIYQYGFLDNERNQQNLLRIFWNHIQE